MRSWISVIYQIKVESVVAHISSDLICTFISAVTVFSLPSSTSTNRDAVSTFLSDFMSQFMPGLIIHKIKLTCILGKYNLKWTSFVSKAKRLSRSNDMIYVGFFFLVPLEIKMTWHVTMEYDFLTYMQSSIDQDVYAQMKIVEKVICGLN